jgi:adenosine deaminase
LAARHGVALPQWMSAASPARFSPIQEFVTAYLAVTRCLRSRVEIAEAIDAIARGWAQQNVRYAEVTFTPMTHVWLGTAVQELHAGLREGRARALEHHGVHVRWVFDVVRGLFDKARPTLEFALAMEQLDPHSVVGLGLGGPETEDDDLAPLGAVFGEAQRHGLRIVPHAGEMAGSDNVLRAIRHLRPDRIGHGFRALDNEAAIDELLANDIALEICPTSNVALGFVSSLSDHPLERLRELGVPIVLSTDDPGLFEVDLVEEYLRCAEAFEWTPQTIAAIARAGFERSFAPSSERHSWLAELDAVADGSKG